MQRNFIYQVECNYWLQPITDSHQTNYVPEIYRNIKPIPWSYFVRYGKIIQPQIPKSQKLCETVNQVIKNLTNKQLFPWQYLRLGAILILLKKKVNIPGIMIEMLLQLCYIWTKLMEEKLHFIPTIAILSRLRQNFILKKFWEIEYLTIRKKLK